MDVAVLLEILEDVMEENQVNEEAWEEIQSHRHRLCDCSWHLAQLLNKVNTPIWKKIVQSQLNTFVRDIKHRQPNGRWALGQYAFKIDTDVDDLKRIYIVTRWVDEGNEPDLKYRNSMAVDDINVNVQSAPQGLSPELLELLKANMQRPDAAPANDNMDRMLKLMEAQTRIQAKSAGVDVSDLLPGTGEEGSPQIETSAEDEDDPLAALGAPDESKPKAKRKKSKKTEDKEE